MERLFWITVTIAGLAFVTVTLLGVVLLTSHEMRAAAQLEDER